MTTKIKFPYNVLDELVIEGYDVELDSEKYVHVADLGEDMDDDFKHRSHIYKRESDGKHFRIDLTYVRYGYEWYEFESDYNDGALIEVEKREKVITTWEAV